VDTPGVFIPIGVLWIIIGVIILVLAANKWDIRTNNPALRFITKLLNQTRIRVFSTSLGLAWMVIGILFVAGVIPPG
jgi:hypothetical protein